MGLFIFLSMLASALFSVLRGAALKVEAVGEDGLWYKKLCGAIVLSMLGYGITGANVSLAYFDLLYAFLGLIVVLAVHRNRLIASDSERRPVRQVSSSQYPTPQRWS